MAEIQTSPCVVDSDVTLVNTTPSPVGPSDAIKSEPMDDSPRKRRSHALAREYLSQAAVNWQCAAEEEDAEDSILYEHASKRRRVTDVFKGHKKGYMRKGNKVNAMLPAYD